MGTGFLRTGKGERRAEYDARREAGDASALPAWRPPGDKRTMDGMTIEDARGWIGRDVIVRDDPNFGKRGRIVKVIADPEHGFLAAVAVYRWERGAWVIPTERGPAHLLRPGRMEIA